MLEIEILGPMRCKDDAVIEAPPGVKLRAILAVLAVRAGAPVTRDELIDELELTRSTRNATNTLQAHVLRLRNWLDTRFGARRLLVTRTDGYLLDIPAHQVDAHRFMAATGRLPDRTETAAAELEAALALWSGNALADAGDGPICRRFVNTLTDRRIVAQERQIALWLATGRDDEAVHDTEHLIARHPFRERLWEHRMVALYRCGRQADAVNSYHEVRHLLDTELGLAPGPGLQTRLREILNQEPSLSQESYAIAS